MSGKLITTGSLFLSLGFSTFAQVLNHPVTGGLPQNAGVPKMGHPIPVGQNTAPMNPGQHSPTADRRHLNVPPHHMQGSPPRNQMIPPGQQQPPSSPNAGQPRRPPSPGGNNGAPQPTLAHPPTPNGASAPPHPPNHEPNHQQSAPGSPGMGRRPTPEAPEGLSPDNLFKGSSGVRPIGSPGGVKAPVPEASHPAPAPGPSGAAHVPGATHAPGTAPTASPPSTRKSPGGHAVASPDPNAPPVPSKTPGGHVSRTGVNGSPAANPHCPVANANPPTLPNKSRTRRSIDGYFDKPVSTLSSEFSKIFRVFASRGNNQFFHVKNVGGNLFVDPFPHNADTEYTFKNGSLYNTLSDLFVGLDENTGSLIETATPKHSRFAFQKYVETSQIHPSFLTLTYPQRESIFCKSGKKEFGGQIKFLKQIDPAFQNPDCTPIRLSLTGPQDEPDSEDDD